MKSFTTKTMAIVTAAAAALTLSACSNDDKDSSGSKETTSAARTTAAAATLPTAADLNTVLTTATDPAAPVEAKIRTVQGGQSAPELFETMTRSKQESGANFQVVDPILPTVSFSVPGNENRKADNVEFIFEDNVWKLSQTWACTLITNTVAPEQVPPMCANDTAAPQPSGAAPAPAPGAAPAPPAPGAPAPASGAAPAPAAPAPAPGAAPAPAAPAPAAR